MSESPHALLRYVTFSIASLLLVAACGGSDTAADPERLCEILSQLDAQDTTGLAAEEALPIIQEGRANYVEAIDVAPEEIKADVETFADGVIQITDLLISAEGDETQIDIAALESVTDDVITPEFDAATERVNDWKASNCS